MYRISRPKGTLVFNDTETEKTFICFENGHMTDIAVVLPNFTNVVTGTLTIHDEDGVTLYTKSGCAKNATTVVNTLSVPVDRGYTAKLTLSGAAGGSGGTATVKLWVDTGRK